MSKLYYIYEYRDPDTNIPFYVGKGSRSRMYHHLTETELNTDNKQKFFKIRSILTQNKRPFIVKIFDLINDEDEAYRLESQLIEKYGRRGYDENGILLNVCKDNQPPRNIGEKNGMFGRTRTNEEKSKIAESRKGISSWNKGIPRSQEVKNAISRANKGRKAWNSGKIRSDEDRQKIKEGHLRKKLKNFILLNKGESNGC